MMEFFYEKKDFFQLKELEKLCQKEKGITSMSVKCLAGTIEHPLYELKWAMGIAQKEILTSLVDDGMVDTDKIGTCVYFWAFPSKASQNRKRKLGELKTQYNSGVKRLKTTEERLVKAKVGKEETDSRAEILSNLNKCKELQAELSAELDKYRECDPEVMQRMKDETVVAKEAANRWTDNIFSIKSWIKNKFCFEDSVIDKQFGIPEDFDYLE